MKVLYQEWQTVERGWVCSISKSLDQLQNTVAELAVDNKAEPQDEPFEVEIPDDCDFVPMINRDTVFLEDDEHNIITFPE